ncbi:MAG: type III-B CRISPR module RAMP protein Cmr6 [Bacteroidetes bacterium]|nr:MAG: type III-B CRISPR module RAMP protein Cmr6 [Bacteroidota bacterium]
MGKKDKQQRTGNSLQDLAKLTGMEKETQSNPNQEIAQNFYSFLHKRNRFYDKDVKLKEKRQGREQENPKPVHSKFEIKKINVDYHTINKKDGRGDDWKEEVKYVEIDKEFIWQSKDFFTKFTQRHKKNAEFLTDNQLKTQNFKPDWRLAIGLGSGSVFETSISLHHIYGFPYIPASAVKGITHHYALENAKNDKDLEAIKTLFGTAYNTSYEFKEENPVNPEILSDKNEQGNIIFFDAYPIESPQGKIKPDIMNNHYDKWYNEGKPPADYYNPNPIIFLTVQALTFQFIVGLRKGIENTNIKLGAKSGDMLSVVSDYLKDALQEHGIGAKTAVGYGYMK